MIPQAIQHSQNKEIIIKRRGSCETAHLERATPFGKRHFSRDLIMNGNWPEKGGRNTGRADAEAWKERSPAPKSSPLTHLSQIHSSGNYAGPAAKVPVSKV